jgi:hypothetical protein
MNCWKTATTMMTSYLTAMTTNCSTATMMNYSIKMMTNCSS